MNRLTTKILTLLFILFMVPSYGAKSQDTTWVQTYTWEAQNNPETSYDSPGRRWFEFPASDNGEEYRKVLMYYNLKCFEDGTAGGLGFACGEWDYLTYNYLFEHTGLLVGVEVRGFSGPPFSNNIYLTCGMVLTAMSLSRASTFGSI